MDAAGRTPEGHPVEEVTATAIAPESLGADPRVTPTIPGGEAIDPGAVASAGERDAAGEAFDAARHEPRRAADGRWRRKRGNGARVAAGKPLSGLPLKSKVNLPPPPALTSQREPEGPAATEPAAAGVVQAELVVGLTLEDYRATGQGLAGLLWMLLRLVLGPAWVPEPGERERYAEAFTRCWHTHQLPRLGGWLELVGLGAESATKRAGDGETRGRLARFAAWLGWKKKDTRAQPDRGDNGLREVGPRA